VAAANGSKHRTHTGENCGASPSSLYGNGCIAQVELAGKVPSDRYLAGKTGWIHERRPGGEDGRKGTMV